MTSPRNGSHVNRIPVLVVGGGPVGLSMGIALNRFGIRSIIVERSPTTTEHPKARGTFVRTMEIFRQWGIADSLKARGLADKTDIFAFRESIVGHEYGRTTTEPNAQHSPVWKSIVAQDAVEEELMGALRTCSFTDVRFSTEMTGFEDMGDCVRVDLRALETGTTETWFADYLVAADGGASGVRRSAGIGMSGPPTLAVMLNEYWRADLSAHAIAKEAAGIRVYPQDPSVPVALTLNTNGADRWLTLLRIGGDHDERQQPWSDAQTIDFIRTHVGLPDLPVQLINRSVWRISRQVAETFRRGRIFIAGDAAHRFPPSGGYGMNTGVQDAHNLAWKLAFVITGIASDGLLDTYDAERRPIAQSNADFAFVNTQRFFEVDAAIASGNADRIAFWLEQFDNHTHSVGRGLGFTYEGGAVVPDGSIPPVPDSRLYSPTDRPGSRFPHIWLDAAQTATTLDWFDTTMTLVAGCDGEAWLDAGRRVAHALAVPLNVHRLERLHAEQGLSMGRHGAVLVRPDGHVAWRMPWLPPNPEAELAKALEFVLGSTIGNAVGRENYARF